MSRRFHFWNRLQSRLPKSWKARYVPGLDRISWYRLLSFYFIRADREDIRMRASFMAFHLVLAVFPATIFFFTLVAYLPLETRYEDLLALLNRLMPDAAYETLADTLKDLLGKQRGGLLSVGFLAAVYFSTSAIDSMIRSFHRSLNIRDKRPYYKKKLYSIWLNLYFSALLMLALVLITLGDSAWRMLNEQGILGDRMATGLWQVLNWLVIVALIQLTVSSLYRFGPYQRSKGPFLNPGSVITTVLIILMSLVLSYYVDRFNTYNRVYGSIGTLLVILLWVYWNCVVTLIGFEFNILLDQVRKRREEQMGRENRMNPDSSLGK